MAGNSRETRTSSENRKSRERAEMPAGNALRHFSEEGISKYLLEVDYPDWEALRANDGFKEKWFVLFLKRSRPIPQAVLRSMYADAQVRRTYAIRLWMMRCKWVPVGIGLNLMDGMRRIDLFGTLKHPYAAPAIKKRIEERLVAEFPNLDLGAKITMARQAPRSLVRRLRLVEERQVARALLLNPFFTHDDALFLACNPQAPPGSLEELARCSRWNAYRDIQRALLRSPRVSVGCLEGLMRRLSSHELRALLKDPQISGPARRHLERHLARSGG